MSISLPDYQAFQPKDDPDDATRWKSWIEGFEAMLGAMNIESDKPATGDHAAKTHWYRLFMHYIGEDSRNILKQLDNNGIEAKSFSKGKKALNDHFSPKLNRVFQSSVLAEIRQDAGESTDSFYHRVKRQIDSMNLKEMSKEQLIEFITLSQLVNNSSNTAARRKAIKDNQTLTEFLSTARAMERTDQQMKLMTEEKQVAAVSKYQGTERRGQGHSRGQGQKGHRGEQYTPAHRGQQGRGQGYQGQKESYCGACGREHVYKQCPAMGLTCAKCHRPNHFAAVCKNSRGRQQRKVNVLENDDTVNDDYSSEESLF